MLLVDVFTGKLATELQLFVFLHVSRSPLQEKQNTFFYKIKSNDSISSGWGKGEYLNIFMTGGCEGFF